MNTYKERLSLFWQKHKKKIIIGMSSLWLLALFNMPTINWIREKYWKQDKIWIRPEYEHEILQLFEQLWYNNRAHTLRMNDVNDIDLGHLKGSQETMESLLHKFSCLKESDDKKIISIPGCWTSYDDLHKQTIKTRLQASYTCQILQNIQDRFDLNDKQVIFVLSTLMHLSLTEYVEYEQSQDWTVRSTSNSWNNSVDFRGNIAGVISTIKNDKNPDLNVSDLQKILIILQQHYKTTDAQSTFNALSKEFDLHLKISEQE